MRGVTNSECLMPSEKLGAEGLCTVTLLASWAAGPGDFVESTIKQIACVMSYIIIIAIKNWIAKNISCFSSAQEIIKIVHSACNLSIILL